MKKIKFFTAAFFLFATVSLISCTAENEPLGDGIDLNNGGTGATVISTTAVTNIDATIALSGGNISSDGGSAITARGIVWSTNQNPTIADSKTTDGSGTGTFSSILAGLTASTTYYVRAYATNTVGTTYGNQVSFVTTGNSNLPSLTTTNASSITASSASIGGNIVADGGSAITARGTVWGLTQNPTTANSKTVDGSGTGSFTSSVTGLTANKVYYARAYATNASGTSYGNQVTFTTATNVIDNSPALMTANIIGVQQNHMQPYFYSFTGNDVIVENNGAPAGDPRYLKIQGDTSDNIGTLTEINIHIPNAKWVPGTYPLTDTFDLGGSLLCQANLVLPYVGGNPDFSTVTAGSVTITEFNLTTRRVKGTFVITYQKGGQPTDYQITNGTFNYALDASYFD